MLADVNVLLKLDPQDAFDQWLALPGEWVEPLAKVTAPVKVVSALSETLLPRLIGPAMVPVSARAAPGGRGAVPGGRSQVGAGGRAISIVHAAAQPSSTERDEPVAAAPLQAADILSYIDACDNLASFRSGDEQFPPIRIHCGQHDDSGFVHR